MDYNYSDYDSSSMYSDESVSTSSLFFRVIIVVFFHSFVVFSIHEFALSHCVYSLNIFVGFPFFTLHFLCVSMCGLYLFSFSCYASMCGWF